MKSFAIPSKLLKLSIFCVGLGAFSYVQAQSIAFFDIQRLRTEGVAYKTAANKVNAEFAKRVATFQDKQAQFSSLQARLDKEGATMSLQDKNQVEHTLVDLNKELQRTQREIQEDRNQRMNEEIEAVNIRVTKVISQVAQDSKIDLVLQDAIYHSPKVDITDKVLTILNKQP